jgi:hypothetical protein
VNGKGDANKRYRVHGDGVDSLRAGFHEIGMPENRRGEARAIVREVVEANDVREFRWYKTEGKDELCCYWDDHAANVLWITPNNVHIKADTSLVRRPQRTATWREDRDGGGVGWLLPGADRGAGGGRLRPKAADVRCPVTYIWQPAGTVCSSCDVVHSEERDPGPTGCCPPRSFPSGRARTRRSTLGSSSNRRGLEGMHH